MLITATLIDLLVERGLLSLVPVVFVLVPAVSERLKLSSLQELSLLAEASTGLQHAGQSQILGPSPRWKVSYCFAPTLQHLMCNHVVQLSRHIARWFVATGFWQVLQGNLMGPGFAWISSLSTNISIHKEACLVLLTGISSHCRTRLLAASAMDVSLRTSVFVKMTRDCDLS